MFCISYKKNMKETKSKTKLGGLFYPKVDQFGNDIPFDSLFIPYIYREIYFEGLYLDVLNQQKDMTIIDMGANIGVTVQHFQPHAKKIYAIEPSTEHFTALKKNKEFNNWDNVELFNEATSDHDGEMTLNTNAGNRTCNSIVLGYGSGSEKVKTHAIDTFFEKNKIEHVDFLKSDTEGAEDLIFRSEGFRKVAPKIDNIMIEFHYPTWTELVKYIMELGYEAKRYESSAVVVMFSRIKK